MHRAYNKPICFRKVQQKHMGFRARGFTNRKQRGMLCPALMPKREDYIPDELVAEFRAKVGEIIQNRPIKIWLTVRRRHRVDTLTSVGTPQARPIRLFDHGAGFYLLGEGVTPDLFPAIHEVFVNFCQKVKSARNKNKLHQLDIRYRSVRATDPYWYNRLIMHYPFSPPQRRIRKGEESE